MLSTKEINLLLDALDSHVDHIEHCKSASDPSRAYEYLDIILEVRRLESLLRDMIEWKAP